MGAVKNGSKFNSVAIGGVIVNGFVKGGQVVYKKEQFDASTKAVFDFATTQGYTLPTNKNAFDTLIRDMKSIGIWDLLDNFYLFTGDGGNNFKRINLINPNKYQATYFGGLQITTKGVNGNGVNSYIDTNFNPSLIESGQKYQLNSASRGCIINFQNGAMTIADSLIDGILPINNQQVFFIGNSIQYSRINNEGNSGITPIGDYIGYNILNRMSITTTNHTFKNNQRNGNAVSSSIYNANQIILRRFNDYSSIGLSCYFMGASISFEISQNFRTIFNKYLSSIGLTPIA